MGAMEAEVGGAAASAAAGGGETDAGAGAPMVKAVVMVVDGGQKENAATKALEGVAAALMGLRA